MGQLATFFTLFLLLKHSESFGEDDCGSSATQQGLVVTSDFEHYGGALYREDNVNEVVFDSREDADGFNGVVVDTSTTAEFTFTDPLALPQLLTIHFWFKMTTIGANDLVKNSNDILKISTIFEMSALIQVNLGAAELTGTTLIAADTLYEVTLFITTSKIELYLDGELEAEEDIGSNIDEGSELEDLVFGGWEGVYKDVEVYTCNKMIYKKLTELTSKEVTAVEGVIRATTADDSLDYGRQLQTFYINPSPANSITYQFHRNHLDCSKARFYVLEQVPLGDGEVVDRWKDYCDENTPIYGWTPNSFLWVKYVNLDPTYTPDSYFQYQADVNECVTAPPCEVSSECHNTLGSYYCTKCQNADTSSSEFKALHTIFFDFENTEEEGIVKNEGESKLPVGVLEQGVVIGGSEVTNFYLDTTIPQSKLTVDGRQIAKYPVGEFTIAMFVKLPDNVAGVRPLFRSEGDNERPHIVFELHDGYPYLQLRDTEGNLIVDFYSNEGRNPVEVNKWTFVAATLSENVVDLFVNEECATADPDFEPNRPLSQDWMGSIKIGHRDESTYLKGYMDDVRLINCRLSPDQVTTLIEEFNRGCELSLSGSDLQAIEDINDEIGIPNCKYKLTDVSATNSFVLTLAENPCSTQTITVTENGVTTALCPGNVSPYVTSSNSVIIHYTDDVFPDDTILSFALDTNECASDNHGCVDASDCVNTDGYHICRTCLHEFGDSLLLYYDFEDNNNQALNKAGSQTGDILTGVTVAELEVFGNALNSKVTGNSWMYAADSLDSRFFTISVWCRNGGVSSDTMFFEVGASTDFIQFYFGQNQEMIVKMKFDNIDYKIEVDAPTTPFLFALVVDHHKFTAHVINMGVHNQETLDVPYTGVQPLDFIAGQPIVLGDGDVYIDEFKLYKCVLTEKLLLSMAYREYTYEQLSGTSETIKAPSEANSDASNFEGRWIVPAVTDKVVFVDFKKIPKSGEVIMIRDDTAAIATDGRQHWHVIDKPQLVKFEGGATINLYIDGKPVDHLDEFVFEYILDTNQCTTNAHDCANEAACHKVLFDYYCDSCDPSESLILHYDFESVEGDENAVKDASDHGNHASFVSSHVTFTDTPSPIGRYAVIGPGQELAVDAWNFSPVAKNAITVAAWLNLRGDNLEGRRPIFNVLNKDGVVLGVDILDDIVVVNVNGKDVLMDGMDALVLEKFFHLAVSVTEGEIKVYINNALEDTKTGEFSWSNDWKKVQVGRKDTCELETLNAYVDDLHVYHCALADFTTLNDLFDPNTYYCGGDLSSADLPTNLRGPTVGQVGTSTTIKCRWTVTVDENSVVHYTTVNDGNGELNVNEANNQLSVLLDVVVGSLADVLVEVDQDVDECLEADEPCGDLVCVNQFQVDPVCKYCHGSQHDEANLLMFYNFDQMSVNNKLVNRALSSGIPDIDLSDPTVIKSSADPINGNYLSQASIAPTIQASHTPTHSYTVSMRVRISDDSNPKQIVLVNYDTSGQKLKIVYDNSVVKFLIEADQTTEVSVPVLHDVFTPVLVEYNSFDNEMKISTLDTNGDVVSDTANPTSLPGNVWSQMVIGFAFVVQDIDEFKLYNCLLKNPESELRRQYTRKVLMEDSGKISPPELFDGANMESAWMEYTWTIQHRPKTTITVNVDTIEVDCVNGFVEILVGGVVKYRSCSDETPVLPDLRLVEADVVVRYVTMLDATEPQRILIGYAVETDECQESPSPCASGHCVNTFGSFHCTQCQDEKYTLLHIDFEDESSVFSIHGSTDPALTVDSEALDAYSARDASILKSKSECGNYLDLTTGKYLSVTTNKLSRVPRQTFTFDALVQLTDTKGCHPLFNVFSADYQTNVVQVDIIEGRVVAKVLQADGNMIEFTSDDNLIVTDWTRITVSADDVSGDKWLKVYINGVENGAGKVFTDVELHAAWDVIEIGRKGVTNAFSLNGYIDEVRLYGCSMDPSVVQAQCNLANIYCDDKFTTGSGHTWEVPYGLGGIFESIDCSFELADDQKRKFTAMITENNVDCDTGTLTYEIDGTSYNFCEDGIWSDDLTTASLKVRYVSQVPPTSNVFSLRLNVDKAGVDCPENAVSINGECFCNNGYIDYQSECVDLDECICGINGCHDNAVCENKEGSYSCHCLPGYSGDGFQCEAKNPCQYTGVCKANEICEWEDQTSTRHLCSCAPGYRLQGATCQPSCVEKGIVCEGHSRCNEQGDGCVCDNGYQLNDHNLCQDKNECDTNPCEDIEKCFNIDGGFECRCGEGYEYSIVKQKCQDVDECKEKKCPLNSFCTNKQPGYECTCKDGFQMAQGLCIDIEECGTDNDCSPHAYCINTEGSYSCHCRHGYQGDGKQCDDIEECSSGEYCGENQECNNEEGSFKCTCAQGLLTRGDLCVQDNRDEDEDSNGDIDNAVETVWQNVEMCSEICGDDGLRKRVCSQTDCDPNGEMYPCNRFPCFQASMIEKPLDVCMEHYSMNDDVTDESVVERLAWDDGKVQHALLFTSRWKPKLALLRHELVCLDLDFELNDFDAAFQETLAVLDDVTASRDMLRKMQHCNENNGAREQLRKTYSKVVAVAWRIEAHMQRGRLQQQFEYFTNICSGKDWMNLADGITKIY